MSLRKPAETKRRNVNVAVKNFRKIYRIYYQTLFNSCKNEIYSTFGLPTFNEDLRHLSQVRTKVLNSNTNISLSESPRSRARALLNL